jgi:hypothetical protein
MISVTIDAEKPTDTLPHGIRGLEIKNAFCLSMDDLITIGNISTLRCIRLNKLDDRIASMLCEHIGSNVQHIEIHDSSMHATNLTRIIEQPNIVILSMLKTGVTGSLMPFKDSKLAIVETDIGGLLALGPALTSLQVEHLYLNIVSDNIEEHILTREYISELDLHHLNIHGIGCPSSDALEKCILSHNKLTKLTFLASNISEDFIKRIKLRHPPGNYLKPNIEININNSMSMESVVNMIEQNQPIDVRLYCDEPIDWLYKLDKLICLDLSMVLSHTDEWLLHLLTENTHLKAVALPTNCKLTPELIDTFKFAPNKFRLTVYAPSADDITHCINTLFRYNPLMILHLKDVTLTPKIIDVLSKNNDKKYITMRLKDNHPYCCHRLDSFGDLNQYLPD